MNQIFKDSILSFISSKALKEKLSASREKQIKRLEQQAAKVEKWLRENDKKIGAYRKELHSNVTDNDSAKMHTSHGTVQGYNSQAIVDSKHQVIVHGEAIGKGLDNDNLPPVVDAAKENLESIGNFHSAKSCRAFKGIYSGESNQFR